MKGVFLEKALLESEAFRSLSRWGLLVYLRFLQKRVIVKDKHGKRSDSYRITNNGQIFFPYKEADDIGIAPREFRNALDELQERGFIDIAVYGKGGRSGDATLYLIDERWRNFGTSSFKPASKPRIKDTRQGRGWAAFNAREKTNPTDKFDSGTTDKIDRRSGKNNKKRMTKLTVVPRRQIDSRPAPALEKPAFWFAD